MEGDGASKRRDVRGRKVVILFSGLECTPKDKLKTFENNKICLCVRNKVFTKKSLNLLTSKYNEFFNL